MHNIADNLTQVQNSIRRAAEKAGREEQAALLLAVSKGQPATAIRSAFAAGQTHFGENYLQEALGKMHQLKDLPIIWHFIGPVQSNKTAAIAEHFSWVHSVDRIKIAQRLSRQRPSNLSPLQVCMQVNIDDETSKSGCSVKAATELAGQIAQLPQLTLRGLMTIPRAGDSTAAFRTLRHLLYQINEETGLALTTLSMGMSDDLASAIAEGSTIVRVGTAIFGPRVAPS